MQSLLQIQDKLYCVQGPDLASVQESARLERSCECAALLQIKRKSGACENCEQLSSKTEMLSFI